MDSPSQEYARVKHVTTNEWIQQVLKGDTRRVGLSERMCVPQLVQHHARHSPDKLITVWIDEKGREVVRYTWSQFFARCCQICTFLKRSGLKKGEVVLLCFEPCQDFLCTFVSCCMLGVIPSAISPPVPGRLEIDLPRLSAIVECSGATRILSSSRYRAATLPATLAGMFSRPAAGGAAWPKLEWLYVDGVSLASLLPGAASFSPEADMHRPAEDDVCYLMFSSGSTGAPTGVATTHRALIEYNLSTVAGHNGADPVRLVTFLPRFHDFGLVFDLNALYHDGLIVGASPLAFLASPLVWLRAIEKYEANTTAAPNFFLSFAAKRLTEAEWRSVNLSSLTYIVMAAEPIRFSACRAFIRPAVAWGRATNVRFTPGYGMAELVVGTACYVPIAKRHFLGFVAASTKDLASGRATILYDSEQSDRTLLDEPETFGEGTTTITNTGIVMSEAVVIVCVDEGGVALPERVVGEVCVASPVATCTWYWRNEDKTAACYRQCVRAASGAVMPGEFYATGDMGFVHNGGLYVCGRKKEMIIIKGANFYPTDIEPTVERAHASLRPGNLCVFSHDTGEQEEVVVVAEMREGQHSAKVLEEVAAAIAAAVDVAHNIHVDAVVLIPAKTIPKTTSAKIQRGKAKQLFLDGQLSPGKGGLWVQSFESSDKKTPQAEQADNATRSAVVAALTAQAAAGSVGPPAFAAIVAPLVRAEVEAVLGGPVDSDVRPLMEIDSVRAAQLASRLNALMHVSINVSDLGEHNTVAKIAMHLASLMCGGGSKAGAAVQGTSVAVAVPPSMPSAAKPEAAKSLLVCGMACFVGSCCSPDELWTVFYNDGPLFTAPPPNRTCAALLPAACLIDRLPPCTDDTAAQLHVPPKVWAALSPIQQTLIASNWCALRDAGVQSAKAVWGARVGVFVGMSTCGSPLTDGPPENPAASSLAAHVGHILQLTGPCMAVDASCASFSHALWAARMAIAAGECTHALVSGANILAHGDSALARELNVLSSQGVCEPFAADCNGTVRSEGVFTVLVRPTATHSTFEAVPAGRPQVAIKGVSVNSSGARMHLSLPSAQQQQEAMYSALEQAGLQPSDVDVVEMQANGLSIGDTAELKAVKEVYRLYEDDPPRPAALLLGTHAPVFGHMEAASGALSLVKMVMCLQRARVPPSPRTAPLNARLALSDVPALIGWEGEVNLTRGLTDRRRLVACVNSYGLSGANSHVVLERLEE